MERFLETRYTRRGAIGVATATAAAGGLVLATEQMAQAQVVRPTPFEHWGPMDKRTGGYWDQPQFDEDYQCAWMYDRIIRSLAVNKYGYSPNDERSQSFLQPWLRNFQLDYLARYPRTRSFAGWCYGTSNASLLENGTFRVPNEEIAPGVVITDPQVMDDLAGLAHGADWMLYYIGDEDRPGGDNQNIDMFVNALFASGIRFGANVPINGTGIWNTAVFQPNPDGTMTALRAGEILRIRRQNIVQSAYQPILVETTPGFDVITTRSQLVIPAPYNKVTSQGAELFRPPHLDHGLVRWMRYGDKMQALPTDLPKMPLIPDPHLGVKYG